MSPVTSTNVATNGAEAVAGPSPTRLNINGINEPERVPHNTINNSETETDSPTQIQ